MIKPIRSFIVRISPVKINGKPPKNDLAPANVVNKFLEKIPPEDEFVQIIIGETKEYICKNNDKNKKQSED